MSVLNVRPERVRGFCLGLAIALPAAPLTAGSRGADEQTVLLVGRATYAKFCLNCHGERGDGDGIVGRNLKPHPGDFTSGRFKYGGTDQDLFDMISYGAAPRGGSSIMGGWSDVIGADERWAVVRYIRTFYKP